MIRKLANAAMIFVVVYLALGFLTAMAFVALGYFANAELDFDSNTLVFLLQIVVTWPIFWLMAFIFAAAAAAGGH